MTLKMVVRMSVNAAIAVLPARREHIAAVTAAPAVADLAMIALALGCTRPWTGYLSRSRVSPHTCGDV